MTSHFQLIFMGDSDIRIRGNSDYPPPESTHNILFHKLTHWDLVPQCTLNGRGIGIQDGDEFLFLA